MSEQETEAQVLRVQLQLTNERLAHLQTLVQQSATKRDLFVFFLCLMLLIFSGGFVMMYRIDQLGTKSNLHWTSTDALSDFTTPLMREIVYNP